MQLGLLTATPSVSHLHHLHHGDTPTNNNSNNRKNWQSILTRQDVYQTWKKEFPFPYEDEEAVATEEDTKIDNNDDNKDRYDSQPIRKPSSPMKKQSRLLAGNEDDEETNKNIDLDPLTAMVLEQEQQNRQQQQIEDEYRRSTLQARRRAQRFGRGTTATERQIPDEDEDYDEAAATLQVIDKDLNRLPLPTIHCVTEINTVNVDGGGGGANGDVTNNMDSVYVNAFQPTDTNHNETSGYDLIATNEEEENAPQSQTLPYQIEDAQRKKVLRQVLFVYQCRHPEPGYRQGMHEIASYLLYALELDLVEKTSSAKSEEEDGNKDGWLVSIEVLSSECYFMLETILSAILPAYDAAVAPGHEKPLEAMSRRVLEWMMRGTGDQILCQRLLDMNVPPAIYLTKWIRLLFSREVQAVLPLWDVFMDLVGGGSGGITTARPKYRWMEVLEVTAAARLLHHRQQLLQSDDCLHYLMNMPMETDIEPLVELMMPLLQGQKIVLPPMAHLPAPTHLLSAQAQDASAPDGNPFFWVSAANGGSHATNGVAGSSSNSTTAQLTNSFKSFSLKQVQKTIAAKTQSISQRIYQEFENMAAENKAMLETQQKLHMPPATDRSYDDDAWQTAIPLPVTPKKKHMAPRNALESHFGPLPPVHPSDPLNPEFAPPQPLSSSAESTMPSASSPAHRFHDRLLSQAMERRLQVLQDFCMNLERQHASSSSLSTTPFSLAPRVSPTGGRRMVPDEVWTALADLEIVRKGLVELERKQPPPSSTPPDNKILI